LVAVVTGMFTAGAVLALGQLLSEEIDVQGASGVVIDLTRAILAIGSGDWLALAAQSQSACRPFVVVVSQVDADFVTEQFVEESGAESCGVAASVRFAHAALASFNARRQKTSPLACAQEHFRPRSHAALR
jgi:hypothetical protein